MKVEISPTKDSYNTRPSKAYIYEINTRGHICIAIKIDDREICISKEDWQKINMLFGN